MSDPELSFLRGYPIWLARQRRWLLGVIVLALAAFAVGLWLTATPQDPFRYEIF